MANRQHILGITSLALLLGFGHVGVRCEMQNMVRLFTLEETLNCICIGQLEFGSRGG